MILVAAPANDTFVVYITDLQSAEQVTAGAIALSLQIFGPA